MSISSCPGLLLRNISSGQHADRLDSYRVQREKLKIKSRDNSTESRNSEMDETVNVIK